MRELFLRVVLFCIRALFRLRYKIEYRGLDGVHAAMKDNKAGALFLPNHPAYLVDPLMIAFAVLVPYKVRPLVTEYMFFNPLLYWIMQLTRALPVPNFDTGVNPLKFSRLQKSLTIADEGLKEGQAFLIYPAGTTKRISREILGGAFAAHELLTKNPETLFILVRITGLWGSRFSRAYTNGRRVDMIEIMKRSLIDALKAFIFFLPRRKVTIEYEVAGKDLPRTQSKLVLNRYLEQWYNKPFEMFESKGEPLSIVPYSLWGGELPRVEEGDEEDFSEKIIPKEIEDEVRAKIAEIANLPLNEITFKKHLTADLCIDSLNMAEIITFLETRYALSSVDPQSLGTVAHVLLAATGQLEAVSIPEIDWDTSSWEKDREKSRLLINDKKTIPEVFLATADKRLFDIIAADPLSGPLSYHTLKARIILLIHALERFRVKHWASYCLLLSAPIFLLWRANLPAKCL